MGERHMLTPHAEVIGSLLRPGYLLDAKRAFEENRIGREELKATEDRAVDEAIALQEDVGLEVVTDGEMRRDSFQSQMTAAVDGFSEHDLDAFLWGEWHSHELGDWSVERPELRVVSKLKRRRFLSADELTYLQTRTKVVPKITLPSPTLFINFSGQKLRATSTIATTSTSPTSLRFCVTKSPNSPVLARATSKLTRRTTRHFSIRPGVSSTSVRGGPSTLGSRVASSLRTL